MKKLCLKILFTVIFCLLSPNCVKAVQFDLLVIPVDIFSVCDNYFCFPEASEISANYIIQELNSYKRINVVQLQQVRKKLYSNNTLKSETDYLLKQYKNTDKIDFQTLAKIAKEFNVKSVILVSSYTTTDKSSIKKSLWETMEISSAFKISYPIKLVTTIVLTDNVNNVVMWSSKFTKDITNNDGYFYALNQAQALSQLEKIKFYFKDFVALDTAQNIYLRFFPKEVRTPDIKKPEPENAPTFVPNALDNLAKPQILRELDEGTTNSIDYEDDIIFTF